MRCLSRGSIDGHGAGEEGEGLGEEGVVVGEGCCAGG